MIFNFFTSETLIYVYIIVLIVFDISSAQLRVFSSIVMRK